MQTCTRRGPFGSREHRIFWRGILTGASSCPVIRCSLCQFLVTYLDHRYLSQYTRFAGNCATRKGICVCRECIHPFFRHPFSACPTRLAVYGLFRFPPFPVAPGASARSRSPRPPDRGAGGLRRVRSAGRRGKNSKDGKAETGREVKTVTAVEDQLVHPRLASREPSRRKNRSPSVSRSLGDSTACWSTWAARSARDKWWPGCCPMTS